MAEKKVLTSEDKLDLILKYTKSARHWAMFRGIVSFLLFLIFVVLPIVGGVFLIKAIKSPENQERFKAIQGQFEEFKNFGETLNKLKSTSF